MRSASPIAAPSAKARELPPDLRTQVAGLPYSRPRQLQLPRHTEPAFPRSRPFGPCKRGRRYNGSLSSSQHRQQGGQPRRASSTTSRFQHLPNFFLPRYFNYTFVLIVRAVLRTFCSCDCVLKFNFAVVILFNLNPLFPTLPP